jgi:hypothetical protein
MELPLWAESVWSCNGGLGRRTGGMDGWWMGKKRIRKFDLEVRILGNRRRRRVERQM